MVAIEVFLSTYLRHGVSGAFAEHVLAEHSIEAVRARLRSPGELFWVSRNLDGIDGFARLTLGADAPCEGCSTFEVATLYVQPRHQGTGKGSALLGACLAEVGRRGGASAWLTVNMANEAALAFYRRRGFAEVGRAEFVAGGGAYENRVLRVDVPPVRAEPSTTTP